MCYGLPVCTQSRRACFYCLIVLLLEVTTLMFWWLSYYCSKDLLSGFTYMLAGHNTSTVNRQRYIPLLQYMVSRFAKVSKQHVLTGCYSTTSLNRIGKCVANPKVQDLVENGNQSLTTLGIQETDINVSSVLSFVLSLYGLKRKKLFFAGPTSLFPGLDNRQTCFTLDTMRRFKWHVFRARYQTNI